ncbi:MAG: cell wall hydrolase [Clostridium sp.]|uniref:cell wall hydrolase n=1 Tax=Clostridium sp. DSM 8431 TaxID=1761781 RepID=UPI0008E79CCE|nr:cell wall hydrolase [Clostridium sp. DSM 8431]MCR4943673.1 cell wall hydrolase [Clostridium sp.]SFU30297.1 N-acetylmuramoyl-L-alanine amidase [Clostridium sp. DSM 8431]
MNKFLKSLLIYVALSFVALSNNILTVKVQAVEQVENINNNIDQVVEVFNHGQTSLYVTKSDIDLLAKLIYAESRGEPYEGKVAVASVVLNRVLDKQFPNTIQGVIFQPKAFSCVKNGNITAYPDDNCYAAAYDALRGADPTNDALYFYNPSTATCSWMKSTAKRNIKTIGHHVFFRC